MSNGSVRDIFTDPFLLQIAISTGMPCRENAFLFCNKQLFSHQVLQVKKSLLHFSEAVFPFANAFHM